VVLPTRMPIWAVVYVCILSTGSGLLEKKQCALAANVLDLALVQPVVGRCDDYMSQTKSTGRSAHCYRYMAIVNKARLLHDRRATPLALERAFLALANSSRSMRFLH
jgi:hypothetical protein